MESRLVLVIEDDEDTANMLAAAIREADYEVVVSGGARLLRPGVQPGDGLLPDFTSNSVLVQPKGFGRFADSKMLDGMNDSETSLVPFRHPGGLFEGAARTLGEVHSDDNGL